MSSYENYSRTSASYDATRPPQGLEIIRENLSMNTVPMKSQALLDAGCGTGQYAAALIDEVSHITAVDLNEAMLAAASSKLSAEVESGRVVFHQASLETLPLDDESVDAVLVNQVLHHVADEPEQNWPSHQRIFAEFARVLKPGGIVTINSCSHAQLRSGFWFYHLIPDAIERICERTCDPAAMASLLKSAGFGETKHAVDPDIVMQDASYFRAEAVLDANWRSGDSIWALAAPDELEAALGKARELAKTGELQSFMKQHDAPRSEIGQLTFSSAQKI